MSEQRTVLLLGPGRQPRSIEWLLHRRRANECDSALRAASSAHLRSNPFQVQKRPNGERFPKKTFSSPPSGTQVGSPLGFSSKTETKMTCLDPFRR
eukprot:scaffold582_cov107-Skeletonema_dohrnii-CCMP3373.AAC.1